MGTQCTNFILPGKRLCFIFLNNKCILFSLLLAESFVIYYFLYSSIVKEMLSAKDMHSYT